MMKEKARDHAVKGFVGKTAMTVLNDINSDIRIAFFHLKWAGFGRAVRLVGLRVSAGTGR